MSGSQNLLEGIQDAWYVDEKEKFQSLLCGKVFCEFRRPDSYFKLIKRIDGSTIECFLGHPNYGSGFFKEITRGYTYFDDYYKRKNVFFTFDKVSLYQLTEIIPESPIKIILKRIDNLPNYRPNTAFMIMPFGDKGLNDFYNNYIKQFLLDKLNLIVYNAKDFTDNDIIIDTIYRSIEESEFIIAETTYNNKNVFYELGYAFAREREIITIQNDNEKQLFFDRAHVRTILYSFDNIEQFQNSLLSTVQTIRSRR